jgi:hypothetical protein
MPGSWDASIISCDPVGDDGSFPIDVIGNGERLDVVVRIRIGANLMQFVDGCELFVAVRNLSQSTTMLHQHRSFTLTPQKATSTQEFRVKFGDDWFASEGDALEVLATLKVTAGANSDYSMARSAVFLVAA